jgi:hypothetical protein
MLNQKMRPFALFLSTIACQNLNEAAIEEGEVFQESSSDLDSNQDPVTFIPFENALPFSVAPPPEEGIAYPPETQPGNVITAMDPCDLSAGFILPAQEDFYHTGDLLSAVVQVPSFLSDEYSIQWENDQGEILSITSINNIGLAHYSGRKLSQEPGRHSIQARLVSSERSCENVLQQPVMVCDGYYFEDFEQEGSEWTAFSDATWSTDGWLELTENEQGRQGAFYNLQEEISSGQTSIRFSFQSGAGIHGGADGLALTFIQPNDGESLEDLVEAAGPGGALGYGIGGSNGWWNGNALTIEVDTWANIEDYEPFDPTELPHIGIMGQADPANHLALLESNSLEDGEFHDLRVDILGHSIKIYLDGQLMMIQKSSIDFAGGYMVFSGSTGWATNVHIVDDLEVYHGCD